MTSHSELRQWAGDSLRGIINVALRPPGRVPVSWGIGNGCFTAQDTIFSGKVLWSGAGRQLLNRTCFLLNRESWRRNYQRMFSFDNLFAAVWEPEHWHIVIEKCVSTAIQRLQPPGEKSNLCRDLAVKSSEVGYASFGLWLQWFCLVVHGNMVKAAVWRREI